MTYADTATTESVDIETLDLSIDDAIPQERTFLGLLAIDEKRPGKFGPEWHYAVKPLSFRLNGETGMFHRNPKIKFSKKDGTLITQGEYGRCLEAIRRAFPEQTKGKKVGIGELSDLGLVGHWVLRTLEYGTDKKAVLENGEPNPNFGLPIRGGSDSLICVKAATPEEIEASGVIGVTPQAPTYSAEDVNALLNVMAGKKVLEYTRGLGRNTTLSAELKNSVMNGSAVNTLVAMGAVELVDGVLQATVTA